MSIIRAYINATIKAVTRAVIPGSGFNYPWMDLPYFSLPSTGVSLLVGEEVTIYGDSLINVPIENNLNVTYTCEIGTQSGNNYVVNPITNGEYELVINFKNGTSLITEKTINLNVIGKSPSGAIKTLIISDSTTNADIICPKINTVLNSTTITYVGTQGTTYKNEGRSGYKITDYALNTRPDTNPSPFFKGGVLDVASYFTDNSIDVPDCLYIRLGINDLYSHSLISGNGLTDTERTTVVNAFKTLIDAFLAYNSALNVIVAMPTITENSGAGWNDDYDESLVSQDLFIEITHKLWVGLTEVFANGIYNSRVDCSYEAIHLDRDEGYPKTDGVHTNGVHFDASGAEQMGVGLSLYLNKLLQSKLQPTDLSVAWEDDYAQISFVDNTGSTSQHEVWESKNGGAYSLATTLESGITTYDNYTYQNENMSFKVRAKSGSWVSEFSDIVSITTPLVIKTNQSTLAQVKFTLLYILAGKTVNIDWGDGTNADYSGNQSNITKDYTITANPYYIKLSGDINSITYFNIISQTTFYGDISKWVIPTGLTKQFYLSSCNFSGDISSWVIPSCEKIILNGNSFIGDLSTWNIPNGVKSLQVAEMLLSGDLSSIQIPSTMTQFYAKNCDFIKIPRGELISLDSSIGMSFQQNNCDSAEVDAYLQYVESYFTLNTPLKSIKIDLSGSGMGVPTAIGITAKTAIEGIFTTAGFVATITVNS